MGSRKTEERDKRKVLVDPETPRHLFDGSEGNGAGCLGTHQQKEQ